MIQVVGKKQCGYEEYWRGGLDSSKASNKKKQSNNHTNKLIEKF
jgi:hypothetical protein